MTGSERSGPNETTSSISSSANPWTETTKLSESTTSIDDVGTATLFRRAKLWLDGVPAAVLAEAARTGLFVGRPGLTDPKAIQPVPRAATSNRMVRWHRLAWQTGWGTSFPATEVAGAVAVTAAFGDLGGVGGLSARGSKPFAVFPGGTPHHIGATGKRMAVAYRLT